MTDMPERIWAVHHETQGSVMIGEWGDTIRHIGGTEYIRADLCTTEAHHASDCAVHNAPAYDAGACDCGAPELREDATVHGTVAVPVDLTEAGKVLEDVTPGPWTVEYKSGLTRLLMNGDCQMCDEKYYPWVPENLKDWEFIAWCREGVPALIALATAQAAQIERLEKEVDKFKGHLRRYLGKTHAEWQDSQAAIAASEARVAKLVEVADYLLHVVDVLLEDALHPIMDVHLKVEEGAKIQSVADARAAIEEVKK